MAFVIATWIFYTDNTASISVSNLDKISDELFGANQLKFQLFKHYSMYIALGMNEWWMSELHWMNRLSKVHH